MTGRFTAVLSAVALEAVRRLGKHKDVRWPYLRMPAIQSHSASVAPAESRSRRKASLMLHVGHHENEAKACGMNESMREVI